jgi:raffinose/stachyose/melibiose transport system permease protein
MEKAMRKPLAYIIFILPAFLLYIAFFIYPTIDAINNSLTSWNGISKDMTYIGLDNYKTAFADDAFWKSVLNNGYFIVFLCLIQLPIILIFSLLIANVKRFQSLYKTAVFLPSIMSTAVIGILWGFMYHPEIGLINNILRIFGIAPVYWLSDAKWAMISILITNAWQWTGFYIVMVLAAILSIPKEIEEAAAIDGATRFQRAMKITIPLIQPIIAVVTMLSIAGAMKAADIILVMTKGGPGGTTDVMATYMLRYAITSFKHGFGNSIAVLIFLFTLILTVLYQYLIARRNERIEY